MKYTIEIDSEMVDKLVVDELSRSRKYWMQDLQQIEDRPAETEGDK